MQLGILQLCPQLPKHAIVIMILAVQMSLLLLSTAHIRGLTNHCGGVASKSIRVVHKQGTQQA